jgi:large subunit ribosomal protein L9
MQVILKEDVRDLGLIGDVVNVKDGYARNFLIPKGLAIEASSRNIKALEHEKKKIQEHMKRAKTKAEELASRLSSTIITIKAKIGEGDKLFGSVTAMDIAGALAREGINIDRKRIMLEEPLKRAGTYAINIKVHSEVSAQLNISVVSDK